MSAVKLSELVEYFQMLDMEMYGFVSRKTGEIKVIFDFDDESEDDWFYEGDFVRLPGLYDLPSFDIMENFADLQSARAQARLYNALHQHRPFRKFKDQLWELNLGDAYDQFLADSLKDFAIDWCQEMDIFYEA